MNRQPNAQVTPKRKQIVTFDRGKLAAAPELLEALELMLSDGVSPECHKKARAAIAKARGKQP